MTVSVGVMLMMTEVPDEVVLVDVPPTPMSSRDGEVLRELLDQPPGPWMTLVIDAINPATLPAFDLPEYAQAVAKAQAWLAAKQVDAVLALSRSPVLDSPDADLAVALCEPIGAAARRRWVVHRLVTMLPATRAALGAGELSERHVGALVEATARITDPILAGQVEARVLAHAAGKTPTELARHARDVIRQLDPDGAQQRAKAARETDTDVIVEPHGEDGMSTLVAPGPVEDNLTVKAATDAYAAGRKAAGDPRRIGQLRHEGLRVMAEQYLTGSGSAATPTAGGRPVEIGITVDLRTALGLRELPGHVPGHGLVPRDVIAEIIRREQPRLRMLVIDADSGRLLHRAVSSYRPTATQVAQVRATYPYSAGPGSTVTANRTDTHHVIPHPDGATAVGNLLPLDRRWHRETTHTPLTVTVDDAGTATWTTVLGQTRTVTPHDYRAALNDNDA